MKRINRFHLIGGLCIAAAVNVVIGWIAFCFGAVTGIAVVAGLMLVEVLATGIATLHWGEAEGRREAATAIEMEGKRDALATLADARMSALGPWLMIIIGLCTSWALVGLILVVAGLGHLKKVAEHNARVIAPTVEAAGQVIARSVTMAGAASLEVQAMRYAPIIEAEQRGLTVAQRRIYLRLVAMREPRIKIEHIPSLLGTAAECVKVIKDIRK